jgi:hypothetical protein
MRGRHEREGALKTRYAGLQSSRHHCSCEAGSSNNSSLAIAPVTIVSPPRRTRKPPPPMASCNQTGWASTTREPSATQESRVDSKVASARSAPVGVWRRSSSFETATRSGFPHSTAISSPDAWPSPAPRAARPDGTRPRGARPCTSRGSSRRSRKDRHHRATRAARRSRHPRTRRRARPRRASRPCASVVVRRHERKPCLQIRPPNYCVSQETRDLAAQNGCPVGVLVARATPCGRERTPAGSRPDP